ncbi:MAG: hypothetical protein ACK5PP_11465 [Acidimicrobiales bacterium]
MPALLILLVLVGGLALLILAIRLLSRVPSSAAWAGPIAPTPAELPGLTAVPWEVESIDRQLMAPGRSGAAGRNELVTTINRLAGAAECGVALPPNASDEHILQVVAIIEQSLDLPPMPAASPTEISGAPPP